MTDAELLRSVVSTMDNEWSKQRLHRLADEAEKRLEPGGADGDLATARHKRNLFLCQLAATIYAGHMASDSASRDWNADCLERIRDRSAGAAEALYEEITGEIA